MDNALRICQVAISLSFLILVLAVQYCIVRRSLVSALKVHIWARRVRAMIYRAAQMSKRIKEGNYEASPAKKEFDKRKKKRELTLAGPKVLVLRTQLSYMQC